MTTVPAPSAGDRLWALLPQLHRMRDAQSDDALRQLIDVLAELVAVIEADLDQLYDDQFVETCAEWVLPYLGELIGYRMLHGEVPSIASPRAEVAHTIGHRRRKGTAAMLEQLARDVTGWPARAVESFELLATTQYLNHIRPHSLATADVRDRTAMRAITAHAGAFDTASHIVDVRRIAPKSGLGSAGTRFNIPDVAVFCWRIPAVRVVRSPLVPLTTNERNRFLIDPLGGLVQLYADPRTEEEVTHVAEPYDVPLPLERRWLDDELEHYYGPELSLLVETAAAGADPVAVDIADVRVSDLSDDGATWAHEPPAGTVAIDPVLGRAWFGTALDDGARGLVTYHYGEAVPAGGSGRHRTMDPEVPDRTATGGEDLQPHLDAVAPGGTLLVADSNRYEGTPTFRTSAESVHVLVRAEDRERPLLVATGELTLDLAPQSVLVLEGLTIAGGPLVLNDAGDTEPRTVVLRDCTLVPGSTRTADGDPASPQTASLVVRHPFASVQLERCVTGPLLVDATLTVADGIVDGGAASGVAVAGPPASGADVGNGTAAGGDATFTACTVIGSVHADHLDATDTAFVAALPAGDARVATVRARRRQEGCVRFSVLPPDAQTGRRYRCVEDVGPRFTSLRFGDAGYAQLRRTTADAIRRGAHDEGEIGATHALYAPQREDNMGLRLEEYLRFGLEAGVVFAS